MSKRARRGQGNVRQLASGSYEAYISLKGVGRLSATYAKESEALEQLARWKVEHVDGRLGRAKPEPEPQPSITLKVLAVLFRDHKVATRKWKPGTARWFDEHNKGIIQPAFGHRPADAITSQELERWLAAQVDRVSIATVKKYETLLAMVFRFGVRTGRLAQDPMAAVDRLKVPDDEDEDDERCLAALELRAILEQLDLAIIDAGALLAEASPSNLEEREDLVALARRDRAFFTLLALTGLRRAEAFRMCWDWLLGLDQGVLKVRRQKRGRPVDLPLAPAAVRALKSLARGQPEHLVFPGFNRKCGSRRLEERDPTHPMVSMRGPLARALKAAKVDPTDVGLHSFRRGFLSLVELAAGDRYSIVRALGRHTRKGRDITARYLFPRWDELVAAVERVEELITGIPAERTPAKPANVISLRAAAR